VKQFAKNIITIAVFLSVSSVPSVSLAGPWFTGPIIAGSGHTIPKGHTNFEMYSLNTVVQGIYNEHGKVSPLSDNASYLLNPVLTRGLTDRIDAQLIIPYDFNHNMGASASEFGDITAGFGYQVLEQKDSRWRPDFRFSILEIFPTGRFEHLNPVKNGTDASGLGSYQTAFNFNFQRLTNFNDQHYLRTRFSMSYVLASDVHIHGLSAYGGPITTDGEVTPGNTVSADLAAEYTLNQNWVAVMEVNASRRNASQFIPHPSFTDIEDFDTIGHDVGKQVSLAPALEFNFSPNVGLIGGVWFPVYGRSTAKFLTYVLALNAYW
jgi:hypothetical protein